MTTNETTPPSNEPHPSSGVAEAGLLVLIARINLSTEKRWNDWHYWLGELKIVQEPPRKLVMVKPPPGDGKKRPGQFYEVLLKGTEAALAALACRCKKGTLLDTKPWVKRCLSLRGLGTCSSEAAAATVAKRRRAQRRLGTEAAEQNPFAAEE